MHKFSPDRMSRGDIEVKLMVGECLVHRYCFSSVSIGFQTPQINSLHFNWSLSILMRRKTFNIFKALQKEQKLYFELYENNELINSFYKKAAN